MGHKVDIDDITTKHMKLTNYDCYQSVTEHIQEKCFDLQVSFVFSFYKINKISSSFFRMNLSLINFILWLIYVKLV